LSHPDHGPALAREVRARTGIDPARCYQCGKCTAGCPMADEMPTPIQRIMRRLQRGDERLLADVSLWYCLSCETCSARCPQQVEPARLLDALRELALEADKGAPPRNIRAFHEAFLEQIRWNGRLYEFGLVMGYKLRSAALLDDVDAAPAMLARGKLAFVPRRIQGLDDIRRIFTACAQPVAREPAPEEEGR
jgi:heterodisulfide reductase subunit C